MSESSKESLPKVLLIDDDQKFGASVQQILKNDYLVSIASDARSGLMAVAQLRPLLVLLDYGLPDFPGIECLKDIKRRHRTLPVIMLTGESHPDTIIDTMKSGANDYVIKGSEDFEANLRFRIDQALKWSALQKRNTELIQENADHSEKNKKLAQKLQSQAEKYEIIGTSKEVVRMRLNLFKLKGTHAFVLIIGENGTGKELVARNLNIQEDDPSRPFIAVNCASIPYNLFESELFGHAKGAFTGAIENKIGKFKAAHGGDIFLDEIGEIPLDLQAKLLRVLQEKTITPVGSNQTYSVDVRVIAATNRNLVEAVRQGKFREDLYFRLNQISINVPGLRERKEDILPLAEVFLKRALPMGRISEPAKKVILKHHWRGNIRELLNTIERACIFAKDDRRPTIKVEHLMLSPLELFSQETAAIPTNLLPSKNSDISAEQFKKCLDWTEKVYLDRSLKLLDGDNSAVYEKIEMSKAHYFRRKKTLGLKDERSDTMAGSA